MLLFRPFGSRGSGAKLCSVLPSYDILVHGAIIGGEYHEDRIEGIAMEFRVSVMLRNLLGVLDVTATIHPPPGQHLNLRLSKSDASKKGIVRKHRRHPVKRS
jgi:hypothetical protein